MQLVARFIPATSTVLNMQDRTDPECRFFQNAIQQCYAQGMVNDGSLQGYYALAPSGLLLGYLHSSQYNAGSGDPGAVAEMLERALARWASLSPPERLL